MDKNQVYDFIVKIEIPICQCCGKIVNKIIQVKNEYLKELKFICEECADTFKISRYNYKPELKLEDVIEVPCPSCPKKNVKILKEEYLKNKKYYDDLIERYRSEKPKV